MIHFLNQLKIVSYKTIIAIFLMKNKLRNYIM